MPDDSLPAESWIDDDGRLHLTVRPEGYADQSGVPNRLPVTNDPYNDLATYAQSLPVDPLPTHEAYTQTAGEKVASILTGGNGQERYQFWPERMVRSALSLPADVMSGRIGPYADPYRNGPIVDPSGPIKSEGGLLNSFGVTPVGGNDPEDELLQRVQDMAGLMGTGPLAMKSGTATLGSGMIKQSAYHGTPNAGFERFKVPDAANEYMPDRALGVHVSKDPSIASTFAEGTGSRSEPVQNGGVYPVNIPEDSHFFEVDQPLHPYIKDLNTPKTSRNIASDQDAIEKLIYSTVYKKNSDILARYLQEARAVPKADALQLAQDMVAGKSVSLPVDGPNWTLDRFIRNFGGKPYNAEDRALSVNIFKKEMQDRGYVGLKYINTSPMETANTTNPISYVIFDPSKHIEGKYTHTLMSDTSKPGMALAALENAPTYYSAVENAVNTATTKSAPANQWLSTIQNSKGVKPEELEWNGLKGWLGSQEGSVSKEQIQSYLNENKTQVNEVNKGNLSDNKLNAIAQQKYNRNYEELGPFQQRTLLNEIQESGIGGETKYSKWQLPGGEFGSYREKLLTLPYKDPSLPEAVAFHNKMIEKYGDDNYWNKMTNGERDEWAALPLPPLKGPTFKSSHWDEPNILAHIRMNDRFVPDENGASSGRYEALKAASGKWIVRKDGAFDKNFDTEKQANDYINYNNKGFKSLHIEEIQSDWHQQGREQGYKLSKEAEAKLEPEFNRIDDKIINSNDEQVMGHPDINQSIKMAVDRKIITPDEAKTYLRYSDSQRLKAVPDAPFKKTWLDLAVKNVLREAALKGYDRLSWTPGEAQAARYDLSKQINKLHVIKTDKGYLLGPETHTGQEAAINNGLPVQENELSNYVGKELADKILKSNYIAGGHIHTFENVDLKIGGEGMHYFYDKMLPNVLEKLTGQKAKVGNVGANNNFSIVPRQTETKTVYDVKNNGTQIATHNTEADAKEYIRGAKDYYKEQGGHKINYIDLPQSVKDTALQKGFPLFSGGLMLNPVEQQPTVKLTPMNHDPFSKGNDSDPEVNNRDDVPYLAGASNTPSGYPINIDRRMPRYNANVKLPNGQPADLWKYLKIHEIEEYKQMKAGVPYEQAHIKGGTVAERQAVEADGVDWKLYEHVMDGYLSEIEHENPKHPPKLLYTKPYPHDKRAILEKNKANE